MNNSALKLFNSLSIPKDVFNPAAEIIPRAGDSSLKVIKYDGEDNKYYSVWYVRVLDARHTDTVHKAIRRYAHTVAG